MLNATPDHRVAASADSIDYTRRKTHRKGWVLSHPADIHCVNFHLLGLAAYGVAFWLYLHPDIAGLHSPWSTAAYVVTCAIMLGWVSGIDVGVNFHNHVHRRIFRFGWLNRWFGRCWTFSGGWPSYFWKHAHLTVHHANVLAADDWTVPRRDADGSFESAWSYCFTHWPWRYSYHLFSDFVNRRGGERVRFRAVKEFAIFLVLWSIPFWIDPVMALLLWVLPQYVGNVFALGLGMYVQHVGCEKPTSEHPYRHSNTFHSWLFNLTNFNIGFHNEHHTHAHVHWTDLPKLHEQMLDAYHADGADVLLPFGYYRASTQLLSGYSWDEVREFD